jgi:hypothetical protein
MSKGPVLTGSDLSKTQKNYINKTFTVDEWCGLKDIPGSECLIDNLPFGKYEACLVCKHRKPLDVPQILYKLMEAKKKCKS